jgi:hypothetical protein
MVSLPCAPELRGWVAESDAREATVLAPATQGLVELGRVTGAERVHVALESVRAAIHGDVSGGPVGSAPAPSALHLQDDGGSGAGTGAALPAPPRQISRALLVGASSMQLALGVALEDELEARGVVVERSARAATGLAPRHPRLAQTPRPAARALRRRRRDHQLRRQRRDGDSTREEQMGSLQHRGVGPDLQ